MNIKFTDCISNQNNKFANFCENYLYFDGISNTCSGCRKFRVYEENDSILKIKNTHIKPLQWKQVVRTIAKLFSIAIFPFIAIIALLGKAINRKTRSYQVLDTQEAPKTNLPVHSVAKKIIDPRTVDIKPPLNKYKDAPKIPNDIPSYLDIRGSESLSNFHLYVYFLILSSKNPELYIPFGAIFELSHIENDVIKNAIDIENSEKHFFAYHLNVSGNHWALVFVDRQKRTIEYYDSKKNCGNHDEIINRLTRLSRDLTEKNPGGRPYELIAKIENSIQPDGHQCGPWTLYFLEERLNNPHVDFNQLDFKKAQEMIKNYRLHVMVSIIEEEEKKI